MGFQFWQSDAEARNEKQVTAALGKSMARIEFDIDGNILGANENFLKVMGYSLSEVVGKHHSIFVADELVKSPAYADFWKKLRSGEFASGAFQRVRKDGEKIWLEATYNPIFNERGKLIKVVKFAADITARRKESAVKDSVLKAIDRSQAVIEFDLDGTILTANGNFLKVMGYELKGSLASITVCLSKKLSLKVQNTPSSGNNLPKASFRQPSSSVLAKMARKSGSKALTTRSSIRMASPSRSLNLQSILQSRSPC